MRVLIVGAGPAGLYAAIRLRRARGDLAIRIVEQNAPDATFGFGVVLSDEALGFLAADDPETVALIEPSLRRWRGIHVVLRGERVVLDGIGFSAIGRLQLIRLLQSRAAELGISPEYGVRLESLPGPDEVDLIIGADGLNSVVRASGNFGAQITWQKNHFAWFGATREFPALTQTFIETQFGPMNAHHYTYAPGLSTFIVEMEPDTFARAGFAQLSEKEACAVCERLFAPTLAGATLISNRSIWRQFPHLWCAAWFDGHKVLVGDALHTAHFSIGSGTRLALEDVVALTRALTEADWDLSRALPAYQAAREPILAKLVAAARRSADWYDSFSRHMQADAWSFALSYLCRAGRITRERIFRLSPGFAAEAAARGLLAA